ALGRLDDGVDRLAVERGGEARLGGGAVALREKKIGRAGRQSRNLRLAGQGLRGAGDQRIAQLERLRRGDERGDETARRHDIRRLEQSGVRRRALLIAGPTASGK